MTLAHHSLVAWQRADDLFIKLHRLSLKAFPAFEKFELGGQLAPGQVPNERLPPQDWASRREPMPTRPACLPPHQHHLHWPTGIASDYDLPHARCLS